MDSKERWQAAVNIQHGHEEVVLGSPSSFSLLSDPTHLSFVLARCKFVMKMLSGQKRVLELGSTPQGILITRNPNITASTYASESSRIQHINLKDQSTLWDLMQTYFHNVFIFGINDEVLHTGFPKMCHFIWAIAVGPKRTRND
jgi:hypothetical protein